MIQVGKKYEIINSVAGNDGLIVTVTGYAGPPGFEGLGASKKERWFIDRFVPTNYGGKVNHLSSCQLKPIRDDRDVISWDEMKDIFIPNDLKVKECGINED